MRVLAACALFTGAVSAVDVYLHPPSALSFASGSAPSPERASLTISQYFGLEFADALDEGSHVFLDEVGGAKNFVSQGQEDGLLLTINEEDAQDVIPPSLRPSFQLQAPPMDTLDSMVSTYLHRAAQAYTSIYSSTNEAALPVPRMLDVLSTSAAADTLLRELSVLVSFLEDAEPASGGGRFAALELTGLAPVVEAYGRKSEQYMVAASTLKAMLESAFERENTRVVLLTYTPAGADKRADDSRQPPPQSPLPKPTLAPGAGSSSSACFTSVSACSNVTSSCSGRGSCVSNTRAGKECFVCACATTKTAKGATEYWAGQACQRKDISQSFTLLAGTVITLLLLVGGSVSLLYSVGNVELPGILTGTAGGKRD